MTRLIQMPRTRGILQRHQTLVLDEKGLPFGYPLHRLNGQDTMTALTLGRVQPIAWTDAWVKTQSDQYQLPSVVQLIDELPRLPLDNIAPLNLRNLFIRDRGRCAYTGDALRIGSPNPEMRATLATIEHVIPRGQGGANAWDNVVLAGSVLNNQKGCQTPEEAGLVLRHYPWVPTLADLLLIWLSTEMLTDLPPDWQEFVQPDELRAHIIARYPVNPNLIEAA